MNQILAQTREGDNTESVKRIVEIEAKRKKKHGILKKILF